MPVITVAVIIDTIKSNVLNMTSHNFVDTGSNKTKPPFFLLHVPLAHYYLSNHKCLGQRLDKCAYKLMAKQQTTCKLN